TAGRGGGGSSSRVTAWLEGTERVGLRFGAQAGFHRRPRPWQRQDLRPDLPTCAQREAGSEGLGRRGIEGLAQGGDREPRRRGALGQEGRRGSRSRRRSACRLRL